MWQNYKLLGLLKLFVSYIYTKLFYTKSRLIRLPFDIRNSSSIDLGLGLTTGVGCRIEAFPRISNKIVLHFGNNVQLNDFVHITAVENVKIGNNVLMASKIYISDCSHGSYSGDYIHSNPNSIPIDRPLTSKPVSIEDNVWLGEFVSVLPGVTIGKGTVVGANSVVSKSLPENVIAVGSPAKPIKKFNFKTSQWEKLI
jgi:acetyltransferase-like isoleucine patch superfamily enzyme